MNRKFKTKETIRALRIRDEIIDDPQALAKYLNSYLKSIFSDK